MKNKMEDNVSNNVTILKLFHVSLDMCNPGKMPFNETQICSVVFMLLNITSAIFLLFATKANLVLISEQVHVCMRYAMSLLCISAHPKQL